MKLRVSHFAQLPCKPFTIEVVDEKQAHFVENLLAHQHLFLYEEKIIPDYCNVITVEMWDDNQQEWTDYYNEELDMEWEEYVETYFSQEPDCDNDGSNIINND